MSNPKLSGRTRNESPMKKFLANFRDNAMTWPDIRITIQLPPYHWKLKPWVWVDDRDCDGFAFDVQWLFAGLWVGWNDPAFVWETD